MFTLKTEKGNLNMITNVNEITSGVLENITAPYNVAKHYAVIAICSRIKLYDLILTLNNSNKDADIKVTSILAKHNIPDFDMGKVGDIVIAPRSVIERGIHLTNNTHSSLAGIKNFFGKFDYKENANTKNDLISSIIRHQNVGQFDKSDIDFSNLGNLYVYPIELKVIAASDIIAIRNSNPIKDVFLDA